MAPSDENADGLSFDDRGEWPENRVKNRGNRSEPSPDPSEVIDVVARRIDFLAELMDGPTHKPVLQSELQVSRSTVYKAIRELEELQLVERVGRGYRPTLVGRVLFEQYEQFRGAVEAVSGPAPLLSALPPECPLSVDFLDDAEAVYTEPRAPYYPIRAFEELLDPGANLRGVMPAVLPSFIDLYREHVVSGGRDSELILESPTAERLVSDYTDVFLRPLSSGRLSIRKTDRRLPFGLLIADDPTPQVAVLVFDTRGELRGLLLNDTEEAYDWATEVWELFRDHSADVTDEVVEAADGGETARSGWNSVR